MSKTTAKTETAEFPTFDASNATDQFRAFAEKGMEQSRDAYAKLKAGAEDAQKAAEVTLENAKVAGADLSLKTLAALRANADADFSYFEALIGARTFSEVVELQTAHMRRRMELAVEQAKEMQALASKAAEDVSNPFKGVFEKAFKELKVA